MSASKREVSQPTSPEEGETLFVTDPDESGIRRVPTAEDDLPDLTDELEELRRATPPPVPPAALWKKGDGSAKAAANAADADEQYDDVAVSMLDFELIAKACPPKLAGYATPNEAYPSVPGIPAYFYVSTPPDPPKTFDYELAFHIAVVWIGALTGGLLALL